MTLTMKEMDDINVLLTEVSMELLGNRFYDIHGQGLFLILPDNTYYKIAAIIPSLSGQAHDTLRELYIPDQKIADDYVADKSDFLIRLGLDPKLINEDTSDTSSLTESESTTKNKPKKLTTPTKKPTALPKRKYVKKITPVNRVIPVSITVEETIKRKMYSELERESKLSEGLKRQYFETNRARMLSGSVDEYQIVAEYHAIEKEQMMTDSAALIEMIKHIKSDPSNATQISAITNNILNIKDDI